jgi:hypothetical protein
MTSDSRTIPAALDRFAKQFPDHDALITDDRSFTAAGLRDEVHQAAAALIGLGVQPATGSPSGRRFVDALPRNAGGKVVKPQLRELA